MIPRRANGAAASVNVREVLNGIFSSGGPVANGALPQDLPPKSTVHDYHKL
jgi:hypothetical protein